MDLDWLGKRYQGTHEPLVSAELWERVQGVLDGRHTARIRGIEKQKYIYYRCSHAKQKCRESYVREEVLLEQFTAILDRIELSESMYGWLVRALKENFGELRRDHDTAVSRLQTERARLRERMKQIYIDNLDGRIETTIFNALSVQFREQERKAARELELRLDADLS